MAKFRTKGRVAPKMLSGTPSVGKLGTLQSACSLLGSENMHYDIGWFLRLTPDLNFFNFRTPDLNFVNLLTPDLNFFNLLTHDLNFSNLLTHDLGP